MPERKPGRGPDSSKASALPFAHAIFTNEAGRILSVFDGASPDRGAQPLPPSALSVAARIGADGLMPPRSRVSHELVGGPMVSVSGDYAFLHATFEGAPPEGEEVRLLRAVLDLETAYAAHLEKVGAPPSIFAGARARVEQVYRANVRGTLSPPSAGRVFVHASIEPRGPGILVLLRLRNFTREPVHGVSVSFASPKDFLRAAALYGTGAAVDLATVHLVEPLEPGEKLLELRLEPQEPREGPLQLALHLPNGTQVPARPLRISVKMPHLQAPRADPSMLAQQVAPSDGDPRDVFRLRYTRAVSPDFAFERVKEAVARERPLKLMEFSAPAPAYHEAWYLAKVAPSGYPMLIEVAVRGPGRLIEVRAATKSLPDLLGVKAEYRRRIRELLSERFMGKRVVVQRSDALSPSFEEAAPYLHSTLLLKHMQGEIGATELWHEMRRTATGGSGEGWQFVAPYADELLDGIGEGGKKARAPRLTGLQAQQELLEGVAETFTRIMSPIALEQTARMGRPGARLRSGLDRGAEAEAEAAED